MHLPLCLLVPPHSSHDVTTIDRSTSEIAHSR